MDKQIWFRLLHCLNKRTGSTITKADISRKIGVKRNQRNTTLANYLHWLTKYRYLRNIDYGTYFVRCRIPDTLSIYSLRWGISVPRR